MHDTLICVPVRTEASRLPNKPLLDVAGKTCLDWTLAGVFDCGLQVDAVAILTDSAEVYRRLEAQHIVCVLSEQECDCGSQRVARYAAAEHGESAIEWFVNWQVDEIELPPAWVMAAIQLARAAEFDCVTLACPLSEERRADPSTVKVAVGPCQEARWFSRAPLAGPVWQHVGLYVLGRKALEVYLHCPPSPCEQAERLEQLRLLEAGCSIGVLCFDRPIRSLNTPADLEDFRRRPPGA